MNGIRLSIADIIVVLGVVWLSHACSTFGSGDVTGFIDPESGDVSGDFVVGYESGQRFQIVLAAAMIAVGALMKLSRATPQADAGAPGGWQPNRRQWLVMWVAFAATALVVFAPYELDGLPIVTFILIGAALLVWQFNRR